MAKRLQLATITMYEPMCEVEEEEEEEKDDQLRETPIILNKKEINVEEKEGKEKEKEKEKNEKKWKWKREWERGEEKDQEWAVTFYQSVVSQRPSA